jgi:hypothetical protein
VVVLEPTSTEMFGPKLQLTYVPYFDQLLPTYLVP